MLWSLVAVLAAAFNALGSVLQRRGAARVPDADAMRLRLALDLAHSPAAVAGVGALAVGVALQAAALHAAPLTLVEPILVAELPFTLLLAALLFRVRIDLRTWAAILLTGGGLAGLLLAAQPSGGSVSRPDALAWAASLGASAALAGLLLWIASRAGGARRAALLGVAAGAGHGLSATLMKAAAVAGSHGVGALFGAWQLYAMLLAGAWSVYVYQNALQAGTLVAAQPALSITDPALSACFGVLLFGEQLRGGALVAAELACAGALAVGVVWLARSQPGPRALEQAPGVPVREPA